MRTYLTQPLSRPKTSRATSGRLVHHIPPSPATTYFPCFTNAVPTALGVSTDERTFSLEPEGREVRRLVVGLDVDISGLVDTKTGSLGNVCGLDDLAWPSVLVYDAVVLIIDVL